MMAEKAPRGSRLIIALFGKRNAGKSQLLNALCDEQVAIVSENAGTTTDPILKHYELLPIGPVSFYDTAGFDDDGGSLGDMRVKATRKVLARSDMALFVLSPEGLSYEEILEIERLQQERISVIIVYNKMDLGLVPVSISNFCMEKDLPLVSCSALTGEGIDGLKESIKTHMPEGYLNSPPLVADVIGAGAFVVCVVPIDLSAPKGRIILPQVQVMREVLDCHGVAIAVQDTELAKCLADLGRTPDLVVTDSQVIDKVAKIVPEEIPTTTFSTVFARSKGNFNAFLEGARAIDELQDGAKILIAEACSHHVEKDDIGRVKIPNWLQKYRGVTLEFDHSVGFDFPEDLEKYALVIHCGSCMMNRAEVLRRVRYCALKNVPITNYGMAISKLQGVLDRVVKPLE